jgi:thioredoxin 1
MSAIKIDEANFKSEVLDEKLPVLVDFWAVWCGPCKIIGPIIEELASEYAGKMKFGKINVDENNSLASQFGVMSIPTLKIFKNGKVVGELIGAAPKQVLEEEIKKHI